MFSNRTRTPRRRSRQPLSRSRASPGTVPIPLGRRGVDTAEIPGARLRHYRRRARHGPRARGRPGAGRLRRGARRSPAGDALSESDARRPRGDYPFGRGAGRRRIAGRPMSATPVNSGNRRRTRGLEPPIGTLGHRMLRAAEAQANCILARCPEAEADAPFDGGWSPGRRRNRGMESRGRRLARLDSRG